MYGTIVSVEKRLAGTYLVGAHASGVSTLAVNDVSELQETGSLVIGADTLVYTAITDNDDPDTSLLHDTVILAVPTVNAYADGAMLTVTPNRPYKVALVSLKGNTTTAVEAHVKHSLHAQIAEGTRPAGTGEIVYLGMRDDDVLVVEDILGREPSIDLAYAAAGSLAVMSFDTYLDGAFDMAGDAAAALVAAEAYADVLFASGGGGSGVIDGGDWSTTSSTAVDGGSW